MDTNTIALITGPVGGFAVLAFASYKLWGRVEKMIDQLQLLIGENTKAMCAMQATAEAQREELRELRQIIGLRLEHSNPAIRLGREP